MIILFIIFTCSDNNHIDADFAKCLNEQPWLNEREEESIANSNFKSEIMDCNHNDSVISNGADTLLNTKEYSMKDWKFLSHESNPVNNRKFDTDNSLDSEIQNSNNVVQTKINYGKFSTELCNNLNGQSLHGAHSNVIGNGTSNGVAFNGSSKSYGEDDSPVNDIRESRSNIANGIPTLSSDQLRLLADINADQNNVNDSFDVIEARLQGKNAVIIVVVIDDYVYRGIL